ncbi:hypothetical protein ACFLZ2_03790 [Candidatus Margulisiibacteriota bacterium]
MSEPIINPANQVNKTDNTSDAAGAASVEPGFIPADVAEVSEVSEAVGIDSVSIASDVPASPAATLGASAVEEGAGYIQSEASLPSALDGFDMNSFEEVSAANEYVDPNNSAIQTLLSTLTADGIINEGMSNEEIALAIHNYITKNYSYIAEKEGDVWATVSEVIEKKGGDCEDLANLEASLIVAALIEKGVTDEEAAKMINAVVVINADTLIGHVYVKFTAKDGSVKYLDPSNATVSKSLAKNQSVLFSYNADTVNIFNKSIDFSALETAGYTVPAENTGFTQVDFQTFWEEKNKVLNASGGLSFVLDSAINLYSTAAASITNLLNTYLVETTTTTYQTIWKWFVGWITVPVETTTTGVYPFQWPANAADLWTTYNALVDSIMLDGVGADLTQVTAMVNGIDLLYTQFTAAIADFDAYVTQINSQWDPGADNVFGSEDADWDASEAFNSSWQPGGAPTARTQLVAAQAALVPVRTKIAAYRDALAAYKAMEPTLFSPSSSFLESVLSYLQSGELAAWDLSQEVLQINETTGIFNYSAYVEACRQALLSAQANEAYWYGQYVNVYDLGVEGVPQIYRSDTPGYYYYNCSSHEIYTWMSQGITVYISSGSNIWPTAKARHDNYVYTVGARQTAQATYDAALAGYATVKANYMAQYGITNDATYNDVLNTIQSEYLYFGGDGYWHVDWTTGKLDSMAKQAADIRATLTTLSLLYEARRDLRGLVDQELKSEADALNGMQINKLFMKKTDKLERMVKETIANIMQATRNLNRAIATQEIMAINQRYAEQQQAIQADTPGMCEDDDREAQMLESENGRLGEINGVNARLSAVSDEEARIAQNNLSNMGVQIEGSNFSEIWNSLSEEIGGVLDQFGYMDRPTIDATDDAAYREMDWALVRSMRTRLGGAISGRRMALMAAQAMADIRNLAHQEMTGVGGRSARTDIAAKQVENEARELNMWLETSISATEERVRLNNQIRDNQRQIQQNNELLQEIENQESKGFWAKVCSIGAGILAVASIWFPPLAIGAVALGVAGGALESSRNREIAQRRVDLEQYYADRDMNLTSDYYEGTNISRVTGDMVLDAAITAEANIRNTLAGMNADNYISTAGVGDGRVSVFDTVAFAHANEQMRDQMMILMLADTARKTLAETRNLVHMEMTRVGGRSSSNITNYAIEAARGEMSFVMNSLYMSLMDTNTMNNRAFDREKNINTYNKYLDAANSAFGWSFVPIIGGPISSHGSNMSDMYAQRDSAQAMADTSWESTAQLDDADLNALLNSFIDTGDGNVGVNSQAVADARGAQTQAFIAASIEATIRKTLRDMRSLTHMEMTSVGSVTGGNFTEQANAINFQTAMQSLQMITNYLSQRAEIMNRANQAQQNLVNINQQIDTAQAGGWTALIAGVVVAVASYFTGGAASLVMNIIVASQLGSSVASAILGITSAINNWTNYNFAQNRAGGGEGDLASFVHAREIMDSSVNSTTTRLEQLEQQCIDEIAFELLQGLGGGNIGVNRGLSSQYKNFIEKLYKAEKIKADVKETLKDLRNSAHEIMSGKSGISVNSIYSILNMKEQSIKAQVDEMFNLLETYANRKNQMNAAQKQLIQAKLQAQMSTISATLQTISVAISLKSALFSKEAAALREARDAVEIANTTKQGVQAAADKYTQAQNNMSRLTMQNMPMQITLSALQVVNQIAFAAIEREALKNYESEAEGRVSNSGITSSAKSSSVVASNYTAGEFGDMAANEQAKAGQAELNTKAHSYEMESKNIDSSYNDKIASVEKNFVMNQAPDLARQILGALLPDKSESALYPKNKDFENMLKSSKRFGDIAPAQQKAVKATVKESAKEVEEAKFSELKQIVMQGMPPAPQYAAVPVKFTPEQQAPQSSSAAIAQADKLIQSLADNTVSTAQETVEQLDPQKVLEQLEAALAKAKNDLTAVKKHQAALQKQAPEAAKATAAFEGEVKKERDKLLKQIDDAEAKIKEWEKSGNNSAVEKAVTTLKKQIIKAKAEYEVKKVIYELSKGGERELGANIQKAGAAVTHFEGEVNTLKGKIAEVKKAIGPQASVDTKVGPEDLLPG